MPAPPRAALTDADLDQLVECLHGLPAPLQPLDLPGIDGLLCGVILQPVAVAATRWLPWALDVEGRRAAMTPAVERASALIGRRHAELVQAIDRRQWFDPWIVATSATPVSEAVLPWVAGFATAMEAFPALADLDDPALIEPLAMLYLHFDAGDLEQADTLLGVIETLEPPADLAEAAEDIVRAVLLIADVTRPRSAPRGRRVRGS